MTSATHKMYRDLVANRTRSILFLCCITLGTASVLTCLGCYAILSRDIRSSYLATSPASAVLHVNSVDAKALTLASGNSEIRAVEARRILFARARVGPTEWRNLALFVIPDFNASRLNRFDREMGQWPPNDGGVLIERDAFQVAHAGVGDTLTFRTDDGKLHELRISGKVHDVGQPQARMENSIYGYITTQTLARIVGDANLDLLLISVARDQQNEAHIRAVASDIKQSLTSAGHTVEGIDFPSPGRHPHADLMDGLLLVIASFGFLMLLLSVALSWNFIDALMGRQLRQVGIMKALGASRMRLVRIYLLQSLALGCIAACFAVPLGIGGEVLLGSFLSRFLNFDIQSFLAPAWVYLAALASAVAVPLVASAIPLWHGLTVPVQRVLTNAGTGTTTFHAGLVDRALAHIGGLTRPVLLAIRNSFRRRIRLVLTCVALTFAGAFFMAALGLRTSMIETFNKLFAAQRYDLTLYLDKLYPTSQVDQALQGVRAVSSHEGWVATTGWISRQPQAVDTFPHSKDDPKPDGANEFELSVVALPASSQFFVPVLSAGRSLTSTDTAAVVVNQAMAQNRQVTVGQKVRLRIDDQSTSLTVVGICKEPLMTSPVVYVPNSLLPPTSNGSTNVVQLILPDGQHASLEAARGALDPNLERAGIHVRGARVKSEFRSAVEEHVLMIYVFLLLASFIVGAVGALGLATTMGINVLERRREIGILRAIGATPRAIAAIVIGEAATVSIIGWCVAVIVTYPLGRLLSSLVSVMLHTGFDFRYSLIGMIIALAAMVTLALGASVAAATSATRCSTKEALAYE